MTGLTTNIHVPMDCYRDVWERLIKGEDFDSQRPSSRTWASVRERTPTNRALGGSMRAAERSRLAFKVGDVLLKFDGAELSRYRELPPLIERRKPGDEVEIEVRRGEETLKLKAKLGQRDD